MQKLLSSFIWHQYHFGTITHFSITFLSSIQRKSLMLQKKGCLNFWSTHSLAFQKISWNQNFWGLPSKTSILESSILVYLQVFQACERPLASIDSCLCQTWERKHDLGQFQACVQVHECTCMPHVFFDQRYMYCLMSNI